MQLPSTQYLNECFTYNPIAGDLFWKERPRHHFPTERGWMQWNSKKAGRLVGTPHEWPEGRVARLAFGITVDGKLMCLSVHRVIFHLMGVPIPDGLEVDHRDRNPANNAWTNLRLGTHSQNNANKIVTKGRKCAHLPKGVSVAGNKYKAQIGFLRKQIYLGRFQTPEAAHEAYMAKAQELYGEFARSN